MNSLNAIRPLRLPAHGQTLFYSVRSGSVIWADRGDSFGPPAQAAAPQLCDRQKLVDCQTRGRGAVLVAKSIQDRMDHHPTEPVKAISPGVAGGRADPWWFGQADR